MVDGAGVMGAFPAFGTLFLTTFLLAAFFFLDFLGDFFAAFLGMNRWMVCVLFILGHLVQSAAFPRAEEYTKVSSPVPTTSTAGSDSSNGASGLTGPKQATVFRLSSESRVPGQASPG